MAPLPGRGHHHPERRAPQGHGRPNHHGQQAPIATGQGSGSSARTTWTPSAEFISLQLASDQPLVAVSHGDVPPDILHRHGPAKAAPLPTLSPIGVAAVNGCGHEFSRARPTRETTPPGERCAPPPPPRPRSPARTAPAPPGRSREIPPAPADGRTRPAARSGPHPSRV